MPRICTVAMNAATNPPGALPMSVTHSKTGWASLSRATGQTLFRGRSGSCLSAPNRQAQAKSTGQAVTCFY